MIWLSWSTVTRPAHELIRRSKFIRFFSFIALSFLLVARACRSSWTVSCRNEHESQHHGSVAPFWESVFWLLPRFYASMYRASGSLGYHLIASRRFLRVVLAVSESSCSFAIRKLWCLVRTLNHNVCSSWTITYILPAPSTIFATSSSWIALFCRTDWETSSSFERRFLTRWETKRWISQSVACRRRLPAQSSRS